MSKLPLRVGAQAGFTFAEVAMGLVLLVTIAAVLINHVTINLQSTVAERDRVFAYSKAEAILAEIQSYIDRNSTGTDALDSLDDGVVPKPNLTIATDGLGVLLPPGHEVSCNTQRNGSWLWSRQVTVQPFTGVNNRNVRYVTVRIFKKDNNGVDHAVADLSAVINSAAAAYPTTQVFDLYLLAIENIPGWWVFMDSIRPFVESTITDLETRNPGLELRTHWITKASFGRNQVYRPFLNEAADSWQTIGDVYHYPAKMPTGSASTYYYVPDNFDGHVSIDGVDTNGYDATLNPYPYALADYYNHAMRYPEELALWQQRVDEIEAREADIAAAQAGGTTPPPELWDMSKEPTLRLFFEDLYSNPEKYQNAMIINLHGELLPMPAMRNYSDAAKSPENLPNVRVVTHPEQLRTHRDPAGTSTEDALFRVYAYNTYEPGFTGSAVMPRPIAVEVVGMDLTDGTTRLRAGVTLQNLRGGVLVGGVLGVGGDDRYFPFAASKHASDALLYNEMYYSAEYVPGNGATEPFTRILLYNTPCIAPPKATNLGVAGAGVANTERSQLYRMSYVPIACENPPTFARDLYSTGAATKNTARWRLRVPAAAFASSMFRDVDDNAYSPGDDVVLTVRTRIWTGGDPANSGTMWPTPNDPDNLSTTYTWWADSAEDVPITERSQFQGDPRHCPYTDLLNHAGAEYRNGYNWDFDTLNNSSENSVVDYPGLSSTYLRNRWRGVMHCDVGRFMEVVRKGLVRSHCVYTTLTGWSYYYMGLGADVGYDSANGYPSSIPVELTPYGFPGATGYVDMITGSRMFPRSGNPLSTFWWGMPWLGELYQDSDCASTWFADDGSGTYSGNLPAGNSATRYYLQAVNSVHSASVRQGYGVAMGTAHQRLASEGCTSFFNVGSSGSTFHHRSSAGTGLLTAIGSEIANNYNFNMPTTAPISRPFHPATNTAGTIGDEFSLAPYNSERYSASLLRLYYTHPSGAYGSGLVQLVDPTNSDAAYVIVNGIDRTVESGSTFIAKFAVLSLVHSYFESGSTSVSHRIKQPPRAEILAPTDISEIDDPATIDIVTGISWVRWDGLPYSQTGTYAETEAELEYVVTYSNDGGTTWRHIQDDSVAEPGTRPTSSTYVLADAGAGDETWTWSVPSASFPQGSYLLRVDCYRTGASIHYSYHKTKLFIQR